MSVIVSYILGWRGWYECKIHYHSLSPGCNIQIDLLLFVWMLDWYYVLSFRCCLRSIGKPLGLILHIFRSMMVRSNTGRVLNFPYMFLHSVQLWTLFEECWDIWICNILIKLFVTIISNFVLFDLFCFDHTNLLLEVLLSMPSIVPDNKNLQSTMVMSKRKFTCRYILHAFNCCNSLRNFWLQYSIH